MLSPEARAYHRKYQRNRRNAQRKNALEALGNKCVKCGFSDRRALQIDHVNGNGHSERESRSHRYAEDAIYRRAIEGDPNLQLLCANCNWIKRHENNEQYRPYPD